MKKTLWLMKKYVILISILSVTFLCMNELCLSVKAETGKRNKIILIDPGHGGIDGGAVSKNGTVEKDLNLCISIMLKNKLITQGYDVVMTREEDKGLYSENGAIRKKKIEDLNNRCKMKENSRCDLFVSIHLNMFPQSKYKGAQVWYAEDSESQKLAHILQQNLINDVDSSNHRCEKPANNSYKILRCGSHIPSVIIECGFLSNPEEESELKDKAYQEKIAESIVKSINSYFYEN